MKFAIITVGRSGSSELIKKLSSKVNVIPKPDNHLFPDKLLTKYGRNVKVIFLTRNIKNVIKSVLQREKDYGIQWIEKHYKNLDSDFNNFNKILKEDTLNFENLYDSYNNQKIFDVLFIKYENLYFNHRETLEALFKFTNINSLEIGYDKNNEWKGNYNLEKDKDIELSWDSSLQKKIDSYDFKLHKKTKLTLIKKLNNAFNKALKIFISRPSHNKNIKIAHLINPFKCAKDNPSYLYHAQPITFESMHKAQLHAQKFNININLYSINYPEDEEIIPKYFSKLPNLNKSTLTEFPEISGKRKLPIIQEMFDSILENSDADFIIFTNSDIGVQREFYEKVFGLITKHKLKSFIINRRDSIPKFKSERRLTKKDLALIYKEKGTKHPGKDCFIVSREILKEINMELMFTGFPPWGNTLFKCIKKR